MGFFIYCEESVLSKNAFRVWVATFAELPLKYKIETAANSYPGRLVNILTIVAPFDTPLEVFSEAIKQLNNMVHKV